MLCDFCTIPLSASEGHTVEAPDITLYGIIDDELSCGANFDSLWLACDACYSLILSHDNAALVNRVCDANDCHGPAMADVFSLIYSSLRILQ